MPKVLIVEDMPVAAKIAGMYFEDANIDAEWVKTGQEAIEKAENNYDLILLDIGLPDVDGFTVAETIRAHHELTGAAMTPIVALSAHDELGGQDGDESIGMDAYLIKPLTAEKFDTILQLMNHPV